MKLEDIKKSFKEGDYVQVCLVNGRTLKGKIFSFGQFEESISLEPCFWFLTKNMKSIEKIKGEK